ncbi:MAG: hypothetical protein ACTSXA_00195 [Candidatus Heimdallarchaeota archaeon]
MRIIHKKSSKAEKCMDSTARCCDPHHVMPLIGWCSDSSPF